MLRRELIHSTVRWLIQPISGSCQMLCHIWSQNRISLSFQAVDVCFISSKAMSGLITLSSPPCTTRKGLLKSLKVGGLISIISSTVLAVLSLSLSLMYSSSFCCAQRAVILRKLLFTIPGKSFSSYGRKVSRRLTILLSVPILGECCMLQVKPGAIIITPLKSSGFLKARWQAVAPPSDRPHGKRGTSGYICLTSFMN